MIDISLVSSHMDVKPNLKVKAHREQPHTRLVMTDMSRTTAIMRGRKHDAVRGTDFEHVMND
jgi:hypothetical protein